MRRFAPFVLVVVFAAACGSDALSKADAQRIARRAQLTVTDLGAGWKKTSDERPDDGASADRQLERCVGRDLDVADDTLAESNTRTFERSTGDVGQQQLVVSSAVLSSEDRAADLYRIVATKTFGDCIAKAFEDELRSSERGVTFTAGTVEVAKGQVEGADRSAHVTAPFTLAVEPLDLRGQVDLVTVSTGQAFSLLFGFSLGNPVGEPTLTRLAGLLVERQHAD